MFFGNSFLSAILDRQGLQVAAPIGFRTQNAESFSPQLLQCFWHELKKKTPPTDKELQKKVVCQQSLLYERGRTSSSVRKTLPYFGTRMMKDLVFENGTTSSEKVPLPMDPLTWRKIQVDFSQFRQSFVSTGVGTQLRVSGSHRKASTRSCWRLHVKSKRDSSSSTSVSATCVDQRLHK